jgi:hypothetical protein
LKAHFHCKLVAVTFPVLISQRQKEITILQEGTQAKKCIEPHNLKLLFPKKLERRSFALLVYITSSVLRNWLISTCDAIGTD